MKSPSPIPRIACAILLSVMSFVAFAEGVLDANTATAEEMAVLPHMDEAMAGAIISNRPYAHDRCAARTSRC